jgi:hypothetical protein
MAQTAKALMTTALRVTAVAGCLLQAEGGLAQETGGVVLNFGIDEALRYESNPGLASPAAKSRVTSRTQLSFGAVSETRTQRLAFATQGTLVAGQAKYKGLSDPSASLSYQLESAASLLNLSASLRRREVDALDFFLASDDLGDPIITAAVGSGTQQLVSYGGKFEFGREAAIGGSVSLNRTETDYSGTNDPSLIDSTRDTARLALRFDLTKATRLTATASTSRLKEVGAATSRTNSLSLGLENDRPNGTIDTNLTVTDTASGQRESLSFGRSLDLPRGSLTARLGLSTRSNSNGTALVGSLGWQQELPNGKLSLSLSQNITGDASDNETRLTRIGIGYSRDFTPLVSGSFNMGLQDSRDTASNLSTRSADLSANLRYALSEDWGLNFGATQRIRDKDGSGRADSTNLNISVGRSFEVRP